MSYVKRRWTVENTWKCSTCHHINRGRDLRCSKCGKPKNASEAYDTSNSYSAPAVTDQKLLEVAKGGANWHCEYCQSAERNIHHECSHCGGPKTRAIAKAEAAKELRKIVDRVPDLSDFDGPMAGPAHERTRSVEAVREVPYRENYPLPKRSYSDMYKTPSGITYSNKEQKIIVASVIAGLILVFSFFYWIFAWHSHDAIVISTHWQHTAHLEQRYTHHGASWDGDEPASHFNDICETRQNGTHDCDPYDCNPHSVSYDCNCHSVSDGEDCHTSCSSNNNGFSECEEICSPRSHTECDSCNRTEYDTCYHQCPTYDQWCEYDYYTWNEINTAFTSGNDHNLSDPNLVATTTINGPQRVRIDREYDVRFHTLDGDADENRKVWDYDPPNALDYHRFHVGSRWRIETNHAGSMRIVRPVH